MSGKSHRERIEEMLRDFPDDDGELRYGLAMAYLAEGNEDKALETFRALLAALPDHVAGHQQLGQLLARRGDEDGAQAAYRAGIAAAQRKGDLHAAGEMANFLAMLG